MTNNSAESLYDLLRQMVTMIKRVMSFVEHWYVVIQDFSRNSEGFASEVLKKY